MQENYQRALELVLKSEGGFTNDKRDPGNQLPDGRAGSTNLGVTQANWETFVGRKVTHEEMKALTPAAVSEFYKENYWDKVSGDSLPSGVDYAAFDFAVNGGPRQCRVLLQRALGVSVDGVFGPSTMAAIAAADSKTLLDSFSKYKEAFYRGLKTFPVFGKGWMNRINAVEKVALTMLV